MKFEREASKNMSNEIKLLDDDFIKIVKAIEQDIL